jgi:hypothetical protein
VGNIEHFQIYKKQGQEGALKDSGSKKLEEKYQIQRKNGQTSTRYITYWYTGNFEKPGNFEH